MPVAAMHTVCWESFVPWVCAARLVSGGLREKVLPARVVCVPTVTIFSLLASKGPKWAFFAMLGEFCTGCGHAYRVRGEFCTVGVRCVASGWWFAGKSSPCSPRMGRNGRFFLCWESFVPGSVRCVAGEWWSAGENSPCRECARCKREIFRPACPKSAKTSDFCRAGRVFSRCVPGRGFAGRAVSRDKPATQPATPVRKARGNQAVTPAPASSLTPGR